MTKYVNYLGGGECVCSFGCIPESHTIHFGIFLVSTYLYFSVLFVVQNQFESQCNPSSTLTLM